MFHVPRILETFCDIVTDNLILVIRPFNPGVRFRIKDRIRITARFRDRVRIRAGGRLGFKPRTDEQFSLTSLWTSFICSSVRQTIFFSTIFP